MNYQLQFSRRVRGHEIRSIGRSSALAGKSLAMRRRWYADDDAGADDTNQPGAEDDTSSSDDAEDNVPELLKQLRDGKIDADTMYKLISDARAEAAAGRQAKKDLKAQQEAQAAAQRKQAEAQGEFKKLWESAQNDLAELQVLREVRTARLEQVKVRNEARLKELPKDKAAIVKSIIEKAGSDDPDKVSSLLDDLLPSLGTVPPPPPMDGGSKGDSRGRSASSKVKLNKASF